MLEFGYHYRFSNIFSDRMTTAVTLSGQFELTGSVSPCIFHWLSVTEHSLASVSDNLTPNPL